MIKNNLNFKEKMTAQMVRNRGFADLFDLRGNWSCELWKPKKSGILTKFSEHEIKNLITTTGKNKILDTMFNAATQTAAASWFVGNINDSGFSAISAADTISSHAGWTEWTSYTQSTRPLWGQDAAASGAITNSSAIVFNFNATGTINGLFVVTNSTKGGTTGMLWSAGTFTNKPDVVSGDELRSTYTLSA